MDFDYLAELGLTITALGLFGVFLFFLVQ